jgi:hypothetical protein
MVGPMSESELAIATRWSGIWEQVEHWAFFGVVVALAIEFAALKFGAPHKKKLDEAKELQIAQLTTEAARLSAAEKDARVAIADANARAEQDRLARVKIEARLTSVANT